MALNSFTSGVNTSFSSQLNDNFSSFSVLAIYTGTAFDAADSSGAGTTTNSHEITITAAQLKKCSYVKVDLMVSAGAKGTGGSSADEGYASLKLEEKYVGGGYSTLYGPTNVMYAHSESLTNVLTTVSYIYTLNANDITNGVTFKITGSATSAGGANNFGAVTNIQTTFVGIG